METKRLMKSPILIVKKMIKNEIPKFFPSLPVAISSKSKSPKEA